MFSPPPYLFPTKKMGAPFRGWALDTIVHLTPPGPNGGMQAVEAVCIFSHWVEVGILASLTN